LKERVRREQRLAARLSLATECLEAAQQERTWAIVESHQSGFSIRQIASATGLSSSRVHQLLGSDESREIPRWLSQQRGLEAVPSQGHSDLQARLAGEMEALRRCRGWLERLERGEMVVVNLRPETDPETEYVSFDRPRVLRVLSRIFADLDELAGFPPIADDEGIMGEDVEARRVRHPKRLTEPDPPPKRLCMREERAALRTLLDLPPSEGGERARPGPFGGTFRPTAGDCVFCSKRRTSQGMVFAFMDSLSVTSYEGLSDEAKPRFHPD
jgi:hypothetical protein